MTDRVRYIPSHFFALHIYPYPSLVHRQDPLLGQTLLQDVQQGLLIHLQVKNQSARPFLTLPSM